MLAAVDAAGVHADVFPATSMLRNCTSVSPSAETTSEVPPAALPHVVPPSVDSRCSYPASPERASVDPDAVRVVWATHFHAFEPPATEGAVGSARSMRAVAAAVPTAGAHAERSPETSTARNWTSVSPFAVTSTEAPAVAPDQDAPPSVDVRYW